MNRLSFGSIGDSKQDAVGVGAAEWDGCSREHYRLRQLLPWDVNLGMTIPRSRVKVKSARAWKLNTIDRPFGRGITEGGNMCLIFLVSNMNKMNRDLLTMYWGGPFQWLQFCDKFQLPFLELLFGHFRIQKQKH